ncbi:DUF1120 domain-containing protein [Stenotrophomonas sp. VV52]|uniref:DUF1120 domain-containing protein n=1 Tax=Stenotrophomonas sp. VV52 TaxID=2066958 RepID=UPI000C9E466F|nr:DUF1120 domain-containing protein [Stenotrophomonas sp. VV52]
MNRSVTLLALAFLPTAAISQTVFAQSADVTIAGRISPASCAVTLDNGGVVEMGEIPAKMLNTNSNTVLGPYPLAIAVTCDSPIRYALQGTDNTDTSTAIHFYGLGLTPAGEKIGGVNVLLTDVIADGVPGYGTASLDSGTTWEPSGGGGSSILRVSLLGFNKESGTVNGPTPIASLRGSLSLLAHIQPARNLTLTSIVPINGSATLNIIYL